jgi:hypothetical protein
MIPVKIGRSRLLRSIYRLVWYRWYKNSRIIVVRGWRTAVEEKICIDNDGNKYPGYRQQSSPLLWWEGRESYGGFWPFFKIYLRDLIRGRND